MAMAAMFGAATPPHSATSNGFPHSSPSLFGKVDDDDELSFDSPKEEASYYRDKYRVAMDLLNETRAELDEFQLSSRELEQELEKELEVTEARQAELQERIMRLETDKDEWKTKFVNLQKMHSSTVSAMQLEMDNLRSERDKTLVAIRDLEMGNDELESKHRVTHSSLLDMDIKYNRAIEEKTLLEQEVIQKQELEEECQRLKDDVRDANNEIAILRDRLARAVVPTPPSSDAPISPMLGNRSEAPSPTGTDMSSATQRSSVSGVTGRTDGTDRTDRSPTVTPRTIRQAPSPRIPRSTTTPNFASPNLRRSIPAGMAPSPSGIPALSRSTTTRNLSTTTNEHGGIRRTYTSANVNQTAKTKGMRLLQDIQTRLKATDDRLGARMPKRSMIPPRKSTPSTGTSKMSTGPPGSAGGAQHSRVAALSKPPPGQATPANTNNSASGVLSPTAWVMLSDLDDTPPARPRDRARDTGSPLDPPRGVGQRLLPQRPGIPSPLAPSLGRSRHSRENTPTSTPTSYSAVRQAHKSARPSGRPPLSVSTGIGSLSSSLRGAGRATHRSHMRASSVSTSASVTSRRESLHSRTSSRSDAPSRAGAMSPTLIPGPSRRASVGSQILSPTSTSGRSSRADRPMSRLDFDSMRALSRSDMRPASRPSDRPPSRSALDRPSSRLDSLDRFEGIDEVVEAIQGRPRASSRAALSRSIGRGNPPGHSGRHMVQSASQSSVHSTTSNASHQSSASAASGFSQASTASAASSRSNATANGLHSSQRAAHASMPPTSGTAKSLRRTPRRSSVGVNEVNAPPTGIPAPKTPVARPSSGPMFMDTPPPVPRIPSNLQRRG